MKTTKFFLLACVCLVAEWNCCQGMAWSWEYFDPDWLAQHAERIKRVDAASREAAMKFVQDVIQTHADPNTCDEKGRPALVKAAYWGFAKEVQQLLDAGADVDVRDRDRVTALIDAVRQGQCEVVQILLARGANVDTKTFGKTALKFAILRGDVDAIRLLLAARAKIEAQIWGEDSALSDAVRGERPDIVRLLLAAKSDVNASSGYVEETALQAAIWGGHDEMVKILLDAKADVDDVRVSDHSPMLSLAAKSIRTGRRAGIVKLLLAARANIHARDSQGRTALDVADRDDVCRLLIAALLMEDWPEGPVELCDMIAGYCDSSDVGQDEHAAAVPMMD